MKIKEPFMVVGIILGLTVFIGPFVYDAMHPYECTGSSKVIDQIGFHKNEVIIKLEDGHTAQVQQARWHKGDLYCYQYERK